MRSLTIDLTKQVVLTEKYLIQYKEKKTNKCAICHHIPRRQIIFSVLQLALQYMMNSSPVCVLLNLCMHWMLLHVIHRLDPFIRQNRNIILYFNKTHYWVMRIASWVIPSNLCAKQTAWLFTDTETISHPPNPSSMNEPEKHYKSFGSI
jgi:hypothetical protein